MKTFIKEIDWLGITGHGFANGYVAIPEGHPMHGKPYDDIDVNVHGGLTFAALADELKDWPEVTEDMAGCWVVGFDTCHFGDDLIRWPKESVEYETSILRDQLIAMG